MYRFKKCIRITGMEGIVDALMATYSKRPLSTPSHHNPKDPEIEKNNNRKEDNIREGTLKKYLKVVITKSMI